MTRDEQMMNAAEAYAEEIGYKDDNDMCCTMNIFCAGWYAADRCSRWIPVEEELPELTIDDWRSENVLFATDDGKSHFGFYSNKGVWFSSVYGFNGHQVTHWMPMPQPPRKEE